MASKSYEKLIEEIGGMSVLELADLVKALETKFGVSACYAYGISCLQQRRRQQQQLKKKNLSTK